MKEDQHEIRSKAYSMVATNDPTERGKSPSGTSESCYYQHSAHLDSTTHSDQHTKLQPSLAKYHAVKRRASYNREQAISPLFAIITKPRPPAGREEVGKGSRNEERWESLEVWLETRASLEYSKVDEVARKLQVSLADN